MEAFSCSTNVIKPDLCTRALIKDLDSVILIYLVGSKDIKVVEVIELFHHTGTEINDRDLVVLFIATNTNGKDSFVMRSAVIQHSLGVMYCAVQSIVSTEWVVGGDKSIFDAPGKSNFSFVLDNDHETFRQENELGFSFRDARG